MGDFSGKKWHPHLNEEARERRDEIQDHLEKKYDNPSHFIREKLREEKALSIEERIQRKQQNLDEIQDELDRLKRIQKERDQQDKLRDKRELLKEKQKQLRQVQESGLKSEDEIREEITEVYRQKVQKYDGKSLSDETVQEGIERQVRKRLEDRPDVDELVEDVQRLQQQVADLNGGRESYFMDLGEVEVSSA
jgi:DNA repair exonuclease SbcCD ATPase subunit